MKARDPQSVSGQRWGTAIVVAWIMSCQPRPETAAPLVIDLPPPAPLTDTTEPSEPTPEDSTRDLAGPVGCDWSLGFVSPNCFFFSGPLDLGRDDALGDRADWESRGHRVRLRFSEDVVFAWSQQGSRARLERRSRHDHGGPWEVLEVLELARHGSAMVGSYHYEECQLGEDMNCPGHCTISAQVTVLPAERGFESARESGGAAGAAGAGGR